jgi:hypothetical protein
MEYPRLKVPERTNRPPGLLRNNLGTLETTQFGDQVANCSIWILAFSLISNLHNI